MLTPQEVSGRAFSKAAFGGYNMAMVDEFLDELTDDYTSLYKENAALKAKLKVLVDKVEEYRATEDSMRAALLTAQRMANTMVEEAEEKKKTMLAGAEDEARAKIGALQSDVELEQRRLNAAKAATAEFLQKTRELAQAQLALIERAPDLTPEEIEEAYEKNTGLVIIETFETRGIKPMYTPAVLCKNHGPFTWGKDAHEAVHNAVVLEEVAKMASRCELINPNVKDTRSVNPAERVMRQEMAV